MSLIVPTLQYSLELYLPIVQERAAAHLKTSLEQWTHHFSQQSSPTISPLTLSTPQSSVSRLGTSPRASAPHTESSAVYSLSKQFEDAYIVLTQVGYINMIATDIWRQSLSDAQDPTNLQLDPQTILKAFCEVCDMICSPGRLAIVPC